MTPLLAPRVYDHEKGKWSPEKLASIHQSRVDDLNMAVDILQKGVHDKFIRNSEYDGAKSIVNRHIEHAVDGYHIKHGYNNNLNSMVMGAYNLPPAYREAVKKGAVHFADFLGTMLPLNNLLQAAKGLIVKRDQEKAMIQAKTPPKTPEERSHENHCQICGREVQAKKGLIAHHGYQRPGSGWQTSSCLGARHKPYEEARDRLPYAIGNLTQYRDHKKKFLNGLMKKPPAFLEKEKFEGYGSKRKSVGKIRHDKPSNFDPYSDKYSYDEYTQIFKAERESAKLQIRMAESTLKDLQARYDNWKKVR